MKSCPVTSLIQFGFTWQSRRSLRGKNGEPLPGSLLCAFDKEIWFSAPRAMPITRVAKQWELSLCMLHAPLWCFACSLLCVCAPVCVVCVRAAGRVVRRQNQGIPSNSRCPNISNNQCCHYVLVTWCSCFLRDAFLHIRILFWSHCLFLVCSYPPPQNVFSASSAIVIVSSRCVIISFFVLPCMCYSVFPPLQHCRISRCIMIMLVIMFMTHSLHTTPIWREATRAPEWQRGLRFLTGMPEMDPLGIEPKAFHMQSGCDTTTP